MKESTVQKSRNKSKLVGMGGERCQGCSVTETFVESEGKGVQNMCMTSDAMWNEDSACYKK